MINDNNETIFQNLKTYKNIHIQNKNIIKIHFHHKLPKYCWIGSKKNIKNID